jgi:hypothetical protein
MEMTHDHNWVAGRAIEALGDLHAMPDVVVPRLIELFDTFEEFDPDEAYGGDHARLCRALATFGPATAQAIPVLERLAASQDDDDDDADKGIRAALRRIRGSE